MKTSLITASLAALTTSTFAAPVPQANINTKAFGRPNDLMMKRSEDITESVNYILVLEKSADGVDAYQEEVDAVADPSKVLGKRGEDITESVNYILVLEKSSDGVDAYQEEVDAVEDPADVLG
ncbi:uncharacterized protein RCC_04296 [Ramularia collo-cygni]|uniref:Uncharacterized protein n=1 Tax=Ramularia collo-cygni TaxID=112498 RepID=A0A2D3UR90_9PEZI|nr:uncharacterized protein RCC_04296 [Ramularia collo-cygni]CZT18451.1 uncharacterized protein RCC_04296 [Ramularia collo-cygni]